MEKNVVREDASRWDAFTGLPWLPEHGFAWSTSPLVPEVPNPLHCEPWLIEVPSARQKRDKRNSPLRNHNLHRSFAALAVDGPSLEGVLEFANRYGFLSHPIALHDSKISKNTTTARRIDKIVERARSRPGDPSSIRQLSASSLRRLNELIEKDPYINRRRMDGESFAHWANESYEMLVLIHLWDALKLETVSKLSKYVSWKQASITVNIGLFAADELKTSSIGLWLTNKESLLDAWKKTKEAQTLGPIRYYILERINSHLSHIAPRLMSSTRRLTAQGAAGAIWSSEVTMVPDCLLSSLYLNFALELSAFALSTDTRLKKKNQKLPPRKCRGCTSWFIPSRTDQIYEPHCREAAKKRRQRAAKAARG